MSKNSKVALVTGASRRVGAEISKRLHAAGFNIVVHYNHSAADAKQLCEFFNQQRHDSAVMLPAELSDVTQLQPLINDSVQQWGRLDVLVNNASRFYKTPLSSANEAEWDDLLNSNLKAPFFLSKYAFVHLQKSAGCIVNLTDIHAEKPLEDYSIYCLSKAGLVMLTKSLAKEFGPLVRVNAVSPGAMIWPEGSNELSEAAKQKILNKIALKRPGEPGDIAQAVLYLVQQADYVTGQILAVDGGRNLSM
jgi:pteridine reductase